MQRFDPVGFDWLSVSAASLWEVAIKFALEKLKLPAPCADIFPHPLETNGFNLLPITAAHCATLLSLPFHHRDAFDRFAPCSSRNRGHGAGDG